MKHISGINKEILRLAWPAIVSNVSVPLLGLCDTAVTGHLGSEVYLSAMSAGAMMINVVYWLFASLRMATTGLTARAYGADDAVMCAKALARSSMLALAIGIMLVCVHSPLSMLLERLIGASPQTSELSALYFSITILGAPAVLFNMVASGWMIGMQNTLYPMVLSVAINVINIALSLTFVFGLKMGFEGVAYGTLTATWLGALGYVWALSRFKQARLVAKLKLKEVSQNLSEFFKVNSDLLARSALIMAVSLAMTAYGARMGDEVLAANAVLMQFFILFSHFSDGFAFSAEALCGKFAGAANRSGLTATLRALVMWGVILAAAATLVYSVFPTRISRLITDNTNVIDAISHMRLWISILPAITVSAFLLDGVYVGLTATRSMLLATASAAALFFVVMTIGGGILSLSGNQLLWTAFLSYLAVRGIVLALLMPHTIFTFSAVKT